LAEAATAVVVPLCARGQVIGALVVQSAKALYDEDVSLLHSVADQVALAISNAQLAAELRARLQQMEALQRIYTREAWEQFLPTRTQTSYEYVQSGFSSPGDLDWPEPDRMPDQLRVVALDTVPSQVGEATTLPVLIAPLGLRDQTFGFLGLYHEQAREWTEEEMDIVAAVAEQVALIMDNARLYEEAQLSAGQERKVREVTAHMRQSLNVESVIRAAVEDMYQALQLDQVIIRLAAAGKERE
jgi:GAF domain-containing protein